MRSAHRRRVHVAQRHCVSALNELSHSFYFSPSPFELATSSRATRRQVPAGPRKSSVHISSEPSISPTAAQARVLSHLHTCADRFIGRQPSHGLCGGDTPPSSSSTSHITSDFPFSYLDSNPFHALSSSDDDLLPTGSYGLSFATAAIPLVADRVALPAVAGAVDLLECLPDRVRSFYSDPALCLRSHHHNGDSGGSTSRRPRARVHAASHDEYVRLLRRMDVSGMLVFTTSPKVVNGVFAVVKPDGSQRLIIDARPANLAFVDPPRVTLPTPDLFTRIVLPGLSAISDASASSTASASPGSSSQPPVFVAKSDLSDFFFRFRIPSWMCPYFALPPVRSDELGPAVVTAHGAGILVFPCMRVLAMGWSHSVFATQTVHEHILNTRVRRCQPMDRVTAANDLSLHGSRVLHAVYIDDVAFISLDREAATLALDEYLSVFDALLLPAKRTKVVWPSSDGVECLGMVIHGMDHTVGVSVEKLRALCAATSALLEQRHATGLEVSRCVGRWTWAMLIARPALSVFNSVYKFVNAAGPIPFDLWPTVRRELWTAVRLAPVLFASMTIGWFRSVVACDASLKGQGVCAATVAEADVAAAAARYGVLVERRGGSNPGSSDPITGVSWDQTGDYPAIPGNYPLGDSPATPPRLPGDSSATRRILPATPRRPTGDSPAGHGSHFNEVSVIDVSTENMAGHGSHFNEVGVIDVSTENITAREAKLNDALLQPPVRWSTIVAAQWKREEHINHLELRSVNTALRWVISSPHSIRRRVLLLSDSQVAVGALTKGRSSAHGLLCRVRPTCALLLATGIQLRVRWIASALNPADEPSRRFS